MTRGGLEIKLEALTDMLPLLQTTENPPPDLGTRSLIYDTGPWKGENLLAGIEIFFQQNAYHQAWKARRRAGERKEHRNKTQNTLLKRISLLKAALTETTPKQPRDEIKGATRKAMQ